MADVMMKVKGEPDSLAVAVPHQRVPSLKKDGWVVVDDEGVEIPDVDPDDLPPVEESDVEPEVVYTPGPPDEDLIIPAEDEVDPEEDHARRLAD